MVPEVSFYSHSAQLILANDGIVYYAGGIVEDVWAPHNNRVEIGEIREDTRVPVIPFKDMSPVLITFCFSPLSGWS